MRSSSAITLTTVVFKRLSLDRTGRPSNYLPGRPSLPAAPITFCLRFRLTRRPQRRRLRSLYEAADPYAAERGRDGPS